MKAERWGSIALILALCVAGMLSWRIMLREPLVVDASSLSELPLQMEGWTGEDVPILGSVAEMLDADFHVQRVYKHGTGALVWLYVGYYGTDRGGRPEHTPWVCYPSNGWNILRSSVIMLDPREGRRANEMLIEKDGRRRLVHFWYQSHRTAGMLGEFDQARERLTSWLMNGRADGSLVRLSTPLDEADLEGPARTWLISFASEITPHFDEYWPVEYAAGEALPPRPPSLSQE